MLPTPRPLPARLIMLAIVVTALAGVALSPSAMSEPSGKPPPRIHTGGKTGAYFTVFCPPLANVLAEGGDKYECTPSDGSFDNMTRIVAEPRDFGFAQLDVLTLERDQFNEGTFQIVRSNDVRECLFAVARNPELKTFGDIAVRADELRFILPPKDSGSAGTFRYLQLIDNDLAHAGSIRYVDDVNEALRLALSADDTVAMFVQFADPKNPRFQLVNRLGGHFIPVIDRNILSARIDGKAIYFAEETAVTDARWIAKGTKVITACTPLVVFSGADGRISDPAQARAHRKAVAAIKGMPAARMHPSDSLLANILKRTRELSATTVSKLVDVSQTAREKAKPLINKAKEATSKALETPKPAAIEENKQTSAETLEKAKEAAKELIAPAGASTEQTQ
ncbi:MAG TPA: hypothetical protein P5114_13050 [Hyphomicrobiaceae bacterium]|nr:hypothetical protein [Hyphomicrobiaceae bacterium]